MWEGFVSQLQKKAGIVPTTSRIPPNTTPYALVADWVVCISDDEETTCIHNGNITPDLAKKIVSHGLNKFFDDEEAAIKYLCQH
jgi:hypothetical protein